MCWCRLVQKCPAEVGQATENLLEALMSTEWGYDWSNGLFGIGSQPIEEDYSDEEDYWSDDDNWGDSSGDVEYEPNQSDYVRAGALKVYTMHIL